ncbi:hypothetical protein MTR67_011923 [Solanum verrucosum]|uniref:Uncharacterized protein n=1 Tax=Solanum verrucosum TaxID=315347 RepID=A0AAF0Q8Y1_SOLVR|nr:hypothetical protein MTR67_011923 [Solanum verrucosum]
MVLEHKAQES